MEATLIVITIGVGVGVYFSWRAYRTRSTVPLLLGAMMVAIFEAMSLGSLVMARISKLAANVCLVAGLIVWLLVVWRINDIVRWLASTLGARRRRLRE